MESPPSRPRRSRLRLYIGVICCALIAAVFSGCQSIGYYKQAVCGEARILAHQQSIRKLIADPKTPASLKAKFELVLKLREFAAQQLKLPSGQSYLKYVDLQRPYVVWTVNISPALSLEPMTWWYPFVGRASYRGYFDEEAARRYAAPFVTNGWDVYLGAVETYSTLGWFKDPLLNTFIDEPDSCLAEIIFHELSHQRLFIEGDTDFNEAFATFVSTEGVRRWYLASSTPEAYETYRVGLKQDRQFVQLVIASRNRLQSVYEDSKLSDSEKLARKQELIAQLRADHLRLKTAWGGKSPYDEWFSEPINNAKLNTISAYYDLVPAFEALLRVNGGDLEKFYQAVAQLGKLHLPQRHAELESCLHK